VRDLRKRGYAVATIDWRGQGHSSRRLDNPLKGHVQNFSEYQIDVAAFVKQVVLPIVRRPILHWPIRWAVRSCCTSRRAGTEVFERFVLCSPIDRPAGLRASLPMRGLMCMLRAAGMGERFIPGGQHRPDQVNGLSRQSPDLGSAPLCPQRGYTGGRSDARIASPTVAWLNAAFAAMGEFRSIEFAGGIRQPVLMLAAGDDTIVSTLPTRRLPGTCQRGRIA